MRKMFDLMRIPQIDEIQNGVSGTDGFPGSFYRSHWKTMKDQVVNLGKRASGSIESQRVSIILDQLVLATSLTR